MTLLNKETAENHLKKIKLEYWKKYGIRSMR